MPPVNLLRLIEKGSPTVSISIYARVLYVLELDDTLLLIAKGGALGRTLQPLISNIVNVHQKRVIDEKRDTLILRESDS